MLVHIPHSSIEIPPDVRRTLLLDDRELEAEILAHVDLHTDVLYRTEEAATVRYGYCRLVVDPERFRDDRDEPMALLGKGAVYVTTTGGKPLRNLRPGEREWLLQRFYDPHHAALTAEVSRILALHDRCLIVDAHSFPSRPLPFERDGGRARPDLCIGTCDYHTPEPIAAAIEALAREHGLGTVRNWPYAGTLTPHRYYRRDRRVQSVMVEVNRGLYMDETTGDRGPGFESTRALVEHLLNTLVRMP